MNTRVVLVADAAVRSDWIGYVPGVKYGNLVDPKKREAKLAEWQNTAYQDAIDYSPIAAVTGEFKGLVFTYDDNNALQNKKGEEFVGTGAESLRDALAKHLRGGYRVMGIGIHTVLKRLYMEGVFRGAGKRLPLPQDLWYFPGLESDVVFDPIRVMQSGLATELPDELLFKFLGIDPKVTHIDAKLINSHSACNLAGLL
jgi:hypothetical protein